MLIGQIIEFELRGLGPPGRPSTPAKVGRGKARFLLQYFSGK